MSPARAVLEECTDAIGEAVRIERAQTGSIKRAVHLTAARLGMSPRRIEAYWWGEAQAVRAHEADAIRRGIAAFHAEAASRLAADLERHRRAKRAAQDALRPVLHLRAPVAPHRQGRLAL